MSEATIAVRLLRPVIDTLYDLFEQAHSLLSNWKPYYHHYFTDLIWRLKQAEAMLTELGYDDEEIVTITSAVYHAVFTESQL